MFMVNTIFLDNNSITNLNPLSTEKSLIFFNP